MTRFSAKLSVVIANDNNIVGWTHFFMRRKEAKNRSTVCWQHTCICNPLLHPGSLVSEALIVFRGLRRASMLYWGWFPINYSPRLSSDCYSAFNYIWYTGSFPAPLPVVTCKMLHIFHKFSPSTSFKSVTHFQLGDTRSGGLKGKSNWICRERKMPAACWALWRNFLRH